MTETPCWLWDGSHFSSGYGQAWSKRLRRSTQAHRFVYEHLVGPIPDGLQIDHLCRVRGCVNPAHLRVVTSRENILADGARTQARKNALKTCCHQGHPFDRQNTYVSRNGKRHCRTCRAAAKRTSRRHVSDRGASPVHGAVSLGSRGAAKADASPSVYVGTCVKPL